MNGNELSKKLKIAMVDAEINQRKLAQLIGITQQQISKWLTGERNPTTESLKRISKALKKPLNYFVEGDSIINSGNNNVVGNRNTIGGVNQIINASSEIELLKKEIELLKRELEVERKEKELLLRNKRKRG